MTILAAEVQLLIGAWPKFRANIPHRGNAALSKSLGAVENKIRPWQQNFEPRKENQKFTLKGIFCLSGFHLNGGNDAADVDVNVVADAFNVDVADVDVDAEGGKTTSEEIWRIWKL